jgi:hypothetical protein
MAGSIRQGDIPLTKRVSALEKWQKTLRSALLSPGLGIDQIQAIKTKLTELATGKTYTGESAAKPGCIDCATHEPYARGYIAEVPTLSALNKMRKAEVTALAEALGLTVGKEDKKSDIIEAIDQRR